VLEHEERLVGGVVGDRIEQGHHAGVRQARHEPHLARAAAHVARVRDIGAEHLDRHGAAERLVGRPVDGGHAAGADQGVEAIAVGKQRADGWIGATRAFRRDCGHREESRKGLWTRTGGGGAGTIGAYRALPAASQASCT
jgi:hypothetical protein